MLFKCTLKVRKALKLRDQDLSGGSAGSSDFHHWYCNLFFMHRRKCLIWMHPTTLFTVLAPDVRQEDFRRFGEIFRSRTREVLAATNGISEADITRLLDEGTDRFAKTDSKSVLGSLNDRVDVCKWYAYDREYEEIDFNTLNYNLNRRPMGVKEYKGYKFASKELREMLESGVA